MYCRYWLIFSFSLTFHPLNRRYGTTYKITNWKEKLKNRAEWEKSLRKRRSSLDCSDIEEEEEEGGGGGGGRGKEEG
jgi:hypothetical protein